MKLIKILFSLSIIIFNNQHGLTQWTSLGTGIESAPRSVWALAVPDENTVWAFTWDSENIEISTDFTRTTDGGLTWQTGHIDVAPGLFVQNAFALDEMTLWLTTYDFYNPGFGNIYKTEDGGETWAHQNTGFVEAGEIPIAIYFFDENKGVCFGGGPYESNNEQIKVYTTENGGELWEKVPASNIPEQLFGEGMNIYINSGLYAAVESTIWFPTTKGRVFKSEDMGHTWEVFETGPLTPPHNPISIAMKDLSNGILTSSFPNEAMRTTDGGETWEALDLPTLGLEAYQVRYIPGTSGTYIVHDGWDVNSTLAWLSMNDGETWEIIDMEVSLSTSEFLSSTKGYGGGHIINSKDGGVYAWEGDLLITSQNDVHKNESVELSPNPASDFVHLQYPENWTPENIKIVDGSGRVYISRETTKGDFTKKVDVSVLPVGIYYLKIQTKEGLFSKVFTKI